MGIILAIIIILIVYRIEEYMNIMEASTCDNSCDFRGITDDYEMEAIYKEGIINKNDCE